MVSIVVTAEWDAEAGVWWAHSDDLPLTTEAPSFDALVERVVAIAPEIAELNHVGQPGETVSIDVVARRSAAVILPAA